MKRKLANVIVILLIALSLVLIFSNQITNKIIENKTEQYQQQFETIEPIQIQENMTKSANFDFEQVESISNETLLKAQTKKKNSSGELVNPDGTVSFNTVGFIAIPSVQIKLPIFLGVANENLLYGTGTVKYDQQLGKGNYSLASHRTLEPNLLFTPLDHINIGDSIYITDKDTVYEYITTDKYEVIPSQSEVIDDIEGKTMITLITCDTIEGDNRLIVQGGLRQTWKFADVPSNVKNAFTINSTTY